MQSRRGLKLILAAGAMSLFPTAGNATRWVQILKSDDGIRYIDTDAIVREDSTVTIWLKVEYATLGKKGEAFTMEKWMHDCANDREKLLALTIYKSNGSVAGSAEEPRYRQEWIRIVPGSIGAGIHERVCGLTNPKSNDSTPQFPRIDVS